MSNETRPTLALPDAPMELREEMAAGKAVAWSEPLTYVTYEAADPSVHPMYFDHRVYQGSSGRIYPVPFIEEVSGVPHERQWEAIHLENEYVRLVVLPELGGRIHVGYDKTTGYDFFYRNNVIKPALVGLGGPWVSGGVEFNWPQHHRPGTYLPVETTIEHGTDGSVTVWCHDHDPFDRMSAQHGVRLCGDSSVVELVVRLHNRTADRQTFLWWANVAAQVNDDYQSFFPEDVRYVADHARRAITAFPEADRPYYGVDYQDLEAETAGAARIDYYRNIKVPTSYMIVDSWQDFFGGYDHGAQAGFVHWAERRISPGKKQWTWGNAPFGHAWDDQLTDGDGPYVELMAGVYTDNQPDFTWLLPGETKTFHQYWYPIPAIGVVSQATPDAAVGVADGVASFTVTSPREDVRLVATLDGDVISETVTSLVPGDVAVLEVGAGDRVEMLDSHGQTLVRWEPAVVDSDEEPWVAEEPPSPTEIQSVDELYLTGLHLMQYRHPTRSPMPYWEEALRRDPGDVRTNTVLGDRAYREGRYEDALRYVDLALQRLVRRNANPQDAEAFYLRGLSTLRMGRVTDAERAFGKAGWDGTWAPAAGFELAQLLAFQGRNRAALRVLDDLDSVAGADARRVWLRSILETRLGKETDVQLEAALASDPLDATIRVLAAEREPQDAGTVFDVAMDLAKSGETRSAMAMLTRASDAPITPAGNFRVISQYALGMLAARTGNDELASEYRRSAAEADDRWAFPCGLDQYDVLGDALRANPDDTQAMTLMGMLLYQFKRREEAMDLWDRAVALGSANPVLLRCAGLAAFNIAANDAKAWELYEKAVQADPQDARILYEQDQLAVRLGETSEARFERLSAKESVVFSRDDLTLEYVNLLVADEQTDRALEIISEREFHPWEGGEGKALAAWDNARQAAGLPLADPPASLGEARPAYVPPAAVREDGQTDYFATSLPSMLLFTR